MPKVLVARLHAGGAVRTYPTPSFGSGNSTAFASDVPHNLVQNPEALGSWNLALCTITANAVSAPDQTATMDKIAETATSGEHSVANEVTQYGVGPWVAGCFAKAAERSKVVVRLLGDAGASSAQVMFNLSDGSVYSTAVTGSGVLIAYGIEDWGNGQYWCWLSAQMNASHRGLFIMPANGSNVTSYAGTAGNGLYVWGVILSSGMTLTPYLESTATKLNDATSNSHRNLSRARYIRCTAQAARTVIFTTPVIAAGTSFYFEATCRLNSSGNIAVGFARTTATQTQYLGQDGSGWGYESDGDRVSAGFQVAYGSTYTAGDTIGCLALYNASTTNWDLYFVKNPSGTFTLPSAAYAVASSSQLCPAVGFRAVAAAMAWECNFGEKPFKGTPPAGCLNGVYTTSTDTERWLGTRGQLLSNGGTLTHVEPRIINSPRFRRAVSCWPWGRGKAGSSLGQLDIANGDSALDLLLDPGMRSRKVSLYVIDTTDPGSEATVAGLSAVGTGYIDTVTETAGGDKQGVLQVVLRNRDLLLDVPIQPNTYPATTINTALRGMTRPLTLGAVRWDPVVQPDAPNLMHDLHQDGRFRRTVEVRDQGVLLTLTTHWSPSTVPTCAGFKRNTSIAGKQCAQVEGAVKVGTSVIDETFSSWTGDNPNGWTVTEQDANNRVTESPTGVARIQKNGGGTRTDMQRNLSLTNGTYYLVQVEVAAWSSGTLNIWSTDGTTLVLLMAIAASDHVGTFYVVFNPTSGYHSLRIGMAASTSGDASITRVKVDTCTLIERLPDWLEWITETQLGVLTSADRDGTGITALDTAAPYELGVHIPAGQSPSAWDLIQSTMAAFTGWAYFDVDGKLKVGRLELPAGTADLTITDADLVAEPTRKWDEAPGLSVLMGYAQNAAIHGTGELAGSVQNATVATELSTSQQFKKAASSVAACYAHANGAQAVPTYHSGGTDAQTEIDRAAGMWIESRCFYSLPVQLSGVTGAQTVNPGQLLNVTSLAADLDAGKLLRVIAVEGEYLGNQVTLEAWG